MSDTVKDGGLGRFGHHPDPAIDFCTEVDAIQALAADASLGLADPLSVRHRIDTAMEFRVGGDQRAAEAKSHLRIEDREFSERFPDAHLSRKEGGQS